MIDQLQQAFLTSDIRFQTLFEQAPFSVQILNLEGRTLLVNPAWKKLWGLSEEFVRDYILKEYNLLEDAQLEQKGILPFVLRGFGGDSCEIPPIEYNPREVGMPGRPRWVAGNIFPLKDEAGVIREVAIIHEDVTAQLREEQGREYLSSISRVLHSSLDRDELFRGIALATVPTAADGFILDLLNGARLERVWTRHRNPEKEDLMKELQRRFPPSLDSPQPSARAIRSGEAELLEQVDDRTVREHTLNEEHYSLIHRIGIRSHIAVPLVIRKKVIGAFNLLITTGRRDFDEFDVTLAMEAARRTAIALDNSRLYAEAQRAVSKRDEFISIASHELKTPITSMKLQTQVFLRRMTQEHAGTGVSQEELRRYMENSNYQLDRLTRLVEDMLDVSRSAQGSLTMELKEVSIGNLTQEVLDRFRDEFAQQGIQVHADLPEGNTVKGDAFRLEQVITNLFTNVIRHGKGGAVHVTLRRIGSEIAVTVRDEGPGVAREDHERIFERFERAVSVRNVSGLGIGLFISREIVRAHEGRLEVNSEIGRGAAFTMTLPAAEERRVP